HTYPLSLHDALPIYPKLILKGRPAVLGEGGRVSEELREALTARRALEDAQGVFAALRGCGNVHFDGQARAAFGELCGEPDVHGRSVEHASELQSRFDAVCRYL